MTTGGGSNLGEATLRLSADSKGLNKDLAQVEKSTAQRLGNVGKTLTKTLTPAALGIGAAVFTASEQINEAFATIRTGTGATGETLEGLQEDFKAVYGSVPGDTQTVATAIADLNTTLGLTGKPLQDAARGALEMADAMGVDASAAINNTARAMEVFGVEGDQFNGVLDRMFVASQDTGLGVEALTGQLQTYGPVLANAGFSMDESIALFGQLHQAGVDASRVFPGINAFLRKAADEAFPDYTKSIELAREELEKNTEEVEDNLRAQQDLAAQIADIADDAIEDHTQSLSKNREEQERLTEQLSNLGSKAVEDHSRAVDRNADSLQKAQQDLTIFNARLAEQGDEVKESTRLANEFKATALAETIAELTAEQERLAKTGPTATKRQEDLTEQLEELGEQEQQLVSDGDALIKTIEETTGQAVDLTSATGDTANVHQDLIDKLRESKAKLDGVQAAERDLTAQEAMTRASLSRFIELQEAGGDASFDLRTALEEQILAIQNASTDTEALNLATSAFGAEGAQRLSIAIRNGAFDLDEMVGSLENASGAVLQNAEDTRTATERFAMMRREVGEKLAGAFQSLPGPAQAAAAGLNGAAAAAGPLLIALPGIGTATKALNLANLKNAATSATATAATIVRTVATVAGTVATTAATVAATAFGVALTIATGPIGLIVLAIAGLVAAAILIWKNWDTIREKTIEIWNKIKDFLAGVWDKIVGFVKDNWDKILLILFPAVGLAVLIVRNWGKIKEIVGNIFKKVYEKIKEWVGKARDFVSGIWDGIAGGLKSALNVVIRALNKALNVAAGLVEKIKKTLDKIPGPNPAGNFLLGVANKLRTGIPELSEGGIIQMPTIAMVGEAGPEAIIPLDRLASIMNGGRTMVFNVENLYGVDDLEDFVQEANLAALRRGQENVLT